ncbi:hypothetical protein NFK84_08990 [Enterobacter ludwigii]|uniref:hypothetical protein n=1 Tax=Enterobacter ludwigii TaxID=299767 RepID=UPI00242EE086|nr:hypothetical protein [Enterobacter ludwigii]WGA06436.1 hypothetical protein NFK84_08990 [Enterobacter ludwigii]
MHRLNEIKKKLDVIEHALNDQYPRFKADPALTELITELKEYVDTERKQLAKQKARGELTEFESCFIEPAVRDVYLAALDKIRRGSKPSSSVNNNICETSTTLSYWLHQIEERKEK